MGGAKGIFPLYKKGEIVISEKTLKNPNLFVEDKKGLLGRKGFFAPLNLIAPTQGMRGFFVRVILLSGRITFKPLNPVVWSFR